MKVVFVGDTCVNGDFANQLNNGEEIISNEIGGFLSNSDYVVANFEGPASDHPYVNIQKPNVRNHKGAIEYLKNKNVKVLNLANNHIADCGIQGIRQTIERIDSNGILNTGLTNKEGVDSYITILERGEIKIALIAITEYSNLNKSQNDYTILNLQDKKVIKKVLKRAKEMADWVIFNFHGGEEYTIYPSSRKRKILYKFIKNPNVDIVIAHHSHTFQGIELFDNKPVFYSLGNFIFDYPGHRQFEYTHSSALLNFIFTKKEYQYSYFPLEIDVEMAMVKRGSDDFIKHIEKISEFSVKNWNRDSFRVLFERKKVKGIEGEMEKGLQNKSMFKLLINKGFYKKIWFVIFAPYYSELYRGALIYKYLNFKKSNKGV